MRGERSMYVMKPKDPLQDAGSGMQEVEGW